MMKFKIFWYSVSEILNAAATEIKKSNSFSDISFLYETKSISWMIKYIFCFCSNSLFISSQIPSILMAVREVLFLSLTLSSTILSWWNNAKYSSNIFKYLSTNSLFNWLERKDRIIFFFFLEIFLSSLISIINANNCINAFNRGSLISKLV